MASIDDDMARMGRTINRMSEEPRLEQIAREGERLGLLGGEE